MTDQPTPPLHEQVRTLEADLVMCREQLAQESERAEEAVKEATSPGSPLVQQADTYRRILGHSAIYTHTGVALMSMSDQIIARLDELAEAEAERDEWRRRAQSWPGTRWACADTEPDSLVRCQKPKGHPGDHRYEDSYGKGIGWQADADEELIEQAARVIAVDSPPDSLDYDTARNLYAANLLRDGDHKAADGGQAPEGGISNGQLLAMAPDRRAEVIASLSPEVCRQLAHIAILGASRLIKESVCDDSHHKARRADEFAELAANLLRDGGEK